MTDYIEREAAIKRFNFAVLDCLGMDPTIRAGDIIKALESIPAADVRPVEWIPVTERLPKEGEFVLVHGNLYPNKHDGGVIAVSKRMDWNYWQGFGRERNITHWMPLPEPPKEET